MIVVRPFVMWANFAVEPTRCRATEASAAQAFPRRARLPRDFTPMSAPEMKRLEALTASYEAEGAWFKKRDTPIAGLWRDDQSTE